MIQYTLKFCKKDDVGENTFHHIIQDPQMISQIHANNTITIIASRLFSALIEIAQKYHTITT